MSDGLPEVTSDAWFDYAAQPGGILNTAAAVTIAPSGGLGVRNYIAGVQVMAEALGAATELVIRDGAGGTVLWRTKIPVGGLSTTGIEFKPPLRGSLANLIEVATLTASVTGSVYVNAQGFVAPLMDQLVQTLHQTDIEDLAVPSLDSTCPDGNMVTVTLPIGCTVDLRYPL
jgi:hypothetical protein